jgi:SGT1 protein
MEVPTISDDTLQCLISPTKEVDLAVLLTQVMSFTTSLIPNHVWHRDSFQLILSKEQESTLECTMRIGDSVDDEWLVVFLLWQVTKRFEVAVR